MKPVSPARHVSGGTDKDSRVEGAVAIPRAHAQGYEDIPQNDALFASRAA